MTSVNPHFEACEYFDPEIWSDLYKDAYGIRPRFSLEDYTPVELDQLWEQTCKELDSEMERERELNLIGQKDLEEKINQLMGFGAKSRGQAILWLLEEDHFSLYFSVEHLMWEFDVAFSMTEMYYAEVTEAKTNGEF